jgi:chromosomal replication initiation ATPase DnaA
VAGGRTQLPTVASIQQAVATRYRIAPRRMREPDGVTARQRRYAWPRQVAMTLAFRLTDHSQNRIAQFFGRDRTTLHYAVKAVDRRCRKNAKLRASMRRVTLELIRKG